MADAKTGGIYFWGAPVTKKDRKEFERVLLARYKNDAEKATARLDNIIDRQVNKAIGILTSTSILAGIALVADSTLALILSFTSILLLLTIFYVRWDRSTRFKSAKSDFEVSCQVVYFRSLAMSAAIILTVLSVLVLLADRLQIF